MATITSIDDAPARYPSSSAGVLYASFLRPADTTPIGTGDVISDSTSTARAIVLPGAGKSGFVTSVMLIFAEASTVNFTVWLFDSEPTNHLDNAALALVASDAPKLIGRYNLLDAGKVPLAVGGTNFAFFGTDLATVNEVLPRKAYATPNGNLYALIQITLGFVPDSEAKINLRVSVEGQ